mmetsp:Transcript_24594/g.27360  ORF Transcript_24594/g.27360 Transcript_24594/m.27360 type:complete len:430 (+) Transcript_24594:58-1347(+)|eukprot:CAMPEP_0168512668 /NCGR_PEP_ID=MMETSP0405-20121227/2949_1 /TAXON_ID=498012 /ORGANISM="Trichosphaerium sp, Strain Am-I-7 wt" /LENGTH=429 /DNA_ID=CAMNT_0008531243 /DNA_START=141 /DNA_END=1430 /DNA_ORIENTATION=+
MVLYQCALICGCKSAKTRSQKTVRRRLRIGIFRACVGVLSAIFFFYFFLLVVLEIHESSLLAHRDLLLEECIGLTIVAAEERGLSVLHLDGFNNTPDVEDRLVVARRKLDDAIETVHRLDDRKVRHHEILDEAFARLEELYLIRQQVDAKTIPSNATLEYFTVVNSNFKSFEVAASFSKYEDVSRGLYGILRDSLYSEYLSIERETVALKLERGYFESQEEFLEVVRVVDQSRDSLEERDVLLDLDDLAFARDLESSPEIIKARALTDEWLNVVLEEIGRHNASHPFDIDPKDWFNNMTLIIENGQALRTRIFAKHDRIRVKHLVLAIVNLVLAAIALILEVIACTMLVYLSYPFFKLFWKLEGASRKLSKTSVTDRQATATDTDEDREPHQEVMINNDDSSESSSSTSIAMSMSMSMPTEESSVLTET